MKRLFPTISHGVIVLAAIRVPPVTAQANRHRPRPAHPGSPHAAPNATPIAATANRPAPAGGRIASPPSSTASAANATPRPRAAPRTAAPTPAPSYTAPPPAPPPAAPRTRRRPPPRRPARSPPPYPGASPARTPGAEHGTPRRARTGPGARRSSGSCPPPGPTAGSQTRTPSGRRTTGSPDAGTPPPGRPPHTHRPKARTAIRWTRATHRLRSLLATATNEGEEGSFNVQTGQMHHDPPVTAGQQASRKIVAGHPAGMLRKSGRQHQVGL